MPPAKAERQVVWLDAEGTTFGKPTDEPLARRRFSAEDIVNAVRRTAERERLERLRADIENGG